MTTKTNYQSQRDLNIFFQIANGKATQVQFDELYELHKRMIAKFLPFKSKINSIPFEEVVRGIFNDAILDALKNHQSGKYNPKNAKFSSYMFTIYQRKAYKELGKATIDSSELEKFEWNLSDLLLHSFDTIKEVIEKSIEMLSCSDTYKAAFLDFLLQPGLSKKEVALRYGIPPGAFRTQYFRYSDQIKTYCIGNLC